MLVEQVTENERINSNRWPDGPPMRRYGMMPTDSKPCNESSVKATPGNRWTKTLRREACLSWCRWCTFQPEGDRVRGVVTWLSMPYQYYDECHVVVTLNFRNHTPIYPNKTLFSLSLLVNSRYLHTGWTSDNDQIIRDYLMSSSDTHQIRHQIRNRHIRYDIRYIRYRILCFRWPPRRFPWSWWMGFELFRITLCFRTRENNSGQCQKSIWDKNPDTKIRFRNW